MTSNYWALGPVPTDEDCVSVDPNTDYLPAMTEECRRYRDMLRAMHPDAPAGVTFGVKTFQHEFGQYKEVVVYYDDDNEEQCRYVFYVEDTLPTTWEAK